jgi:hypothetical protein
MKDVPGLLSGVEKELAADRERFEAWDRAMYAAHYQAAHRLDPARAADLKRRYEFQLRVQQWIGELSGWQDHVQQTLQGAAGKELSSDDFQTLVGTLREATAVLRKCHADAADVRCPAMASVADGQPLAGLIVDPGWRPPSFDRGGSVDGSQIGPLLGGYGTTLDRLRRVFFKGMGNILATQERIAADYGAAAVV